MSKTSIATLKGFDREHALIGASKVRKNLNRYCQCGGERYKGKSICYECHLKYQAELKELGYAERVKRREVKDLNSDKSVLRGDEKTYCIHCAWTGTRRQLWRNPHPHDKEKAK